MEFSANGTASVGTSIWSSKGPALGEVGWQNKTEPLNIGGHKKTVSLGGTAALMSDNRQHLANGKSGVIYDHPPFTSFINKDWPAIDSSPTSLPTSPTGFTGLGDPFQIIAGDRYGAHMLSRSVSPPRSSSLSARAAPFEVSPRRQVQLQPSPGPPLGHVLPPRRRQPQVIPPRQQRIQQQQQQQHQESAFNFADKTQARPSDTPVVSVQRRTHARTRSDLAPRFNADLPILHEVTSVPAVHITCEPTRIPSPPPRSLTPQPYHRPSIVVRDPVEQDWFKAWKRRPGGPSVPSLAEYRDMLIAAGRVDPSSVSSRSTRSILAGRTATTPGTSDESATSPKPKRYSLDSDSSSSSLPSSEGSVDNSSVPTTPHKSRFFPAFLQDRLPDSALSSPTQSLFSSRNKGVNGGEPICPALRVTPPPPEMSSSPSVSPTESQYSVSGHNVRILQRTLSEVSTSAAPVITCTPPTASGAWIDLNEDSEHTAIRGETDSAAEVACREERGRLMMTKLKRRSHAVSS